MVRSLQTISVTLFFALSLISSVSCRNRSRGAHYAADTPLSADPATFADPAPPSGYTVLAKALGDLDADGREDLALAIAGADSGRMGAPRKLLLYHSGSKGWQLWHESTGPLMGSMDNERSGDPFHSLGIEDGMIVIHHLGGSRRRWDYLHRYRLIGVRWELASPVISSGELCDTFETIDYRSSTGDVTVSRESNNCDETGTELPGAGNAQLIKSLSRK